MICRTWSLRVPRRPSVPRCYHCLTSLLGSTTPAPSAGDVQLEEHLPHTSVSVEESQSRESEKVFEEAVQHTFNLWCIKTYLQCSNCLAVEMWKLYHDLPAFELFVPHADVKSALCCSPEVEYLFTQLVMDTPISHFSPPDSDRVSCYLLKFPHCPQQQEQSRLWRAALGEEIAIRRISFRRNMTRNSLVLNERDHEYVVSAETLE